MDDERKKEIKQGLDRMNQEASVSDESIVQTTRRKVQAPVLPPPPPPSPAPSPAPSPDESRVQTTRRKVQAPVLPPAPAPAPSLALEEDSDEFIPLAIALANIDADVFELDSIGRDDSYGEDVDGTGGAATGLGISLSRESSDDGDDDSTGGAATGTESDDDEDFMLYL